MGLLDGGSPLTWEETKKNADLVKATGVQQFLAIYDRLRDRENDTLKWGDEVRSLSLTTLQFSRHILVFIELF